MNPVHRTVGSALRGRPSIASGRISASDAPGRRRSFPINPENNDRSDSNEDRTNGLAEVVVNCSFQQRRKSEPESIDAKN